MRKIKCEKYKEKLIEDRVNVFIPWRVGDGDEYVEFASRQTDSCRSYYSNDLCTVVKDKEGHTVDDYSSTERKMSEECRNKMNVADYNKTVFYSDRLEKWWLWTDSRQDRDLTEGK
jgi:hypothetical protein